MASVKYTLDEFVEDLKALRAREKEVSAFLNKGADLLERLVRNPEAVPQEFRVPAGERNHATYALYRENPEGEGIVVTAVVWGPGDFAAAHDHHTWGLIGVLQNQIEETRYRRLDDRTKDDWARIEKEKLSTYKPGEITVLTPEVDEIHRMDNPSGIPTAEVHVYGHDLMGLNRCRFDPETGKITRFVTPRYDN